MDESAGEVAIWPLLTSEGRANEARWRVSWIELAALGAICFGIVMRLSARPGAPLWLDEAATGAIVSQTDFSSFIREAYWEVSSPLYFLLLKPWTAVFGLSDGALRFPSVIFSAAAPIAIALVRLPGISRTDRLVWAALIALWIPGAGFAQDARCYALVLCLATVQTLAFWSLLQRTNLRSTCLWVASCALTTAAHYDAAVLAIGQGVVFLALKRIDAVKQVPALLITVPVVAVIVWQYPEMARYLNADTTWYHKQNTRGVASCLLYLLGDGSWVVVLPVIALGAFFLARRSHSPPANFSNEAWWTALASVGAAAALILVATVRPILTVRYLAPFVPGTVLLVLLSLRSLGRKYAAGIVQTCLLICGVSFGLGWLGTGALHRDSVLDEFNYETASNDLMKSGVKTVIFTWDNPNGRAMHAEQVQAFGEFFFRRAGARVRVIPAQPPLTSDPSVLLLQAARPTGAAIIWLYDRSVAGTAATNYPPHISQLDPRWRCSQSGLELIHVVTCVPQ
jgi:hypothetical protein